MNRENVFDSEECISDPEDEEFDPYSGMRSVKTPHEKKEHQRR
jgi:hypothetical protein